jgi:hypothetical protein
MPVKELSSLLLVSSSNQSLIRNKYLIMIC